jgi:acyl-ACP thioesterase
MIVGRASPALEFVPLPTEGRCFSEEFVVRLGDADPSGNLRPDGVARFLQDIATDDWEDTGIEATDSWVVRRTALRVASGGRWPQFKERLLVTTWCGGYGAAWAERRTDISVEGKLLLEAVAIWVPIDPTGHPVRIRPEFFAVYGDQIRQRKVSGRVDKPVVAEGAATRPWPLRRADLDVVRHVNNAAVWQAVSEVVTTPVREVIVTHHGPVESDHEVTLATAPGALWLLVDGSVRVAVEFSS